MTDVVLATATPSARDGSAQAAAAAVAAARSGSGPVLLVTLEHEPRRPGATLLAAPDARELERALRASGAREAVARGHICRLPLPAETDALSGLAELLREHAAGLGAAFVHAPGGVWGEALDVLPAGGGLLRAELPRDRSLAALAVAELRDRGIRARVATRALGWVAGRRALAGIDPGGAAASRIGRLCRGLLGAVPADAAAGRSRGQAMPAMLGASLALIAAALVLVAIGGAVTGVGRAQRTADLAAVSAARSLRDDAPRLGAPRRLPSGAVNPRHLEKAAVLARAEGAARQAAARNGVAPGRLRVEFPDAGKTVPIRALVVLHAEVADLPSGSEGAPPPPIPVIARATAEAAPPPGSWTGMPATATGGGYSGPLAYRQSQGMRPDVAAGFDRMATAARKAGIGLTISSAFRSDAEQAKLFAAHPDPTWVAPPGHSLHRCATELDLGPPSAYGWLNAHAGGFGFLKRYSWEPWHFGYAAGPAPCSAAGDAVTPAEERGGGDGDGLPAFVPARYRAALERAAARWNVSAALLAAQIMAESGFNPHAVSPAGAQGIAQFMPGTAAGYGLRDPFDPDAAIDAQAHLMADNLRQFGSIPLALAAYNAGSAAVAACRCVPPYPETRAYVARILALLHGSGVVLSAPLEVRLVR